MIAKNTSSFTTSIRRAAGESSLLAFARLYLPHRFGLSPSQMHREVADDLMSHGHKPLRLLLTAPNGYGKTTLVSYALPLWALAYRRARCIVIGSRTRGAAGELLRGVDQEIRRNILLQRDFPHLADVARSSGASGSRASPPRDLYVGGTARLTTIGPSTSLSEISFEGAPPDLFILDGWPGEESMRSACRRPLRSRADHRLERRILDPFPDAAVIVVGALTRAADLTALLISLERTRSWTQRRYKAVERYPDRFEMWFEWAALRREDPDAAAAFLEGHWDELHEGAKVLWPARESYARLMELRAERGWEWFDRHRQCRPPEGDGAEAGRIKITADLGDDDSVEPPYAVDDAGYRRLWPLAPWWPPPVVVSAQLGDEIEPQAPSWRPLPKTAWTEETEGTRSF